MTGKNRITTWLALPAALLAGLILASIPWQMPAAGLDPSWQSAVEMAYLRGLVFGRDFSFTSGPLSFVYTRLFHPQTYPWVLIGMLHAAAVHAAVIWWCPDRRFGLVAAAVLVACFAPLNRDALAMSLPLAVFLLSVTQRAPAAVIAVLVAGLALTSLSKFSVLVLTLPLLVLADLTALAEGRRRCWHAALYGLALTGAYWLSGQPLGALPDFIAGSFDIASGYGQTMGNFNWTAQQALIVFAAAAFLASAARLLFGRISALSLGCFVAFACYLFLCFKLGNVRAGHQYITWHAFACAGFLLVLLPVQQDTRQRLPVGLAVGFIVACLTIHQLHAIGFQPKTLVANRVASLTASLSTLIAWANPKANVARLFAERQAADIRLAARAPRGLSGTVTSLPWELSELIAAGIPIVPLPSLQSYSNYSPRLRALTHRHFETGTRPDHLFFQLDTIDQRIRGIDLGPALVPILAGYDLIRRYSSLHGGSMQLRRRMEPRAVAITTIASLTAELGRWTDAPKHGPGALMLALQPRETIFGKLLTIVYKQQAFEIDLRFASGTVMTGRVFPDLIADGFLVLRPNLTDAQLFIQAADGFGIGQADPLAAIRLRPMGLGSLRFQPTYDLVARTVAIAGVAERPSLDDPVAANAMQALIDGRIIHSPEVRLIQDRLMAHAPSRILTVMPQGGRLTGEIGFFDGAWQDGNPKPVTFTISRVRPDGSQVLLRRTLDPKANPADRGPQAFSVEVGPKGPHGEPLELQFETGPETSWGWSYWSRLRLVD